MVTYVCVAALTVTSFAVPKVSAAAQPELKIVLDGDGVDIYDLDGNENPVRRRKDHMFN